MKKRLPDWLTIFFKKEEVTKYLISVSLIVVSLLLTGRVERWREASRDRERLQEYLVAIQKDVKHELDADRKNLKDCRSDIRALETVVNYSLAQDTSKADSVLFEYANMMFRGVFRSFPPSTYDMMTQSGEARLIKNLELRNAMSTCFSFRSNILQPDLRSFDRELIACTEKLGKYIHLARLADFELKMAWLDRQGFFQTPRNEVVQLLRNAELRAFHLEVAVENFSELDSLVAVELAK